MPALVKLDGIDSVGGEHGAKDGTSNTLMIGEHVLTSVSHAAGTSVLEFSVGCRSGSGGNSVGVVSVLNLESSGVGAPERRPRHDKRYHEV